jgi:hypothetical protein
MRHWGPEYELNGAVCQRLVVVDYETVGIITSYGEYQRDVAP